MDPVAIVGMAFKMPQEATDEGSLWDMVASGRNVLTEWPSDRINVDGFHDSSPKKQINTLHGRGGYFTKDDPAAFDARFFSVPGREAAAMDPQQRWALETCFHALENAGMGLESVRGSAMAVFTSSMSDDYARIQSKDLDTAARHGGIGTTYSAMANRVSWFLDARGPSMHVDTACSSGLIALHMACQTIASGDATSAIIVGSSALLSPDMTTLMANLSFLSPDSCCHSFDESANGYARGEGIVAVVIKPLSQAVAAGDMIRAVIRGTASNQDGRTPTLTQPSANAQESLIRQAYDKAGLPISNTRYFEAHGTGTPVGDPIETTALGRVFGAARSPSEPLYIGSIKANIGHLEAASGLAALAKCVLVLEKGFIPPVALFNRLNPKIDASGFNLAVPTHCLPWPRKQNDEGPDGGLRRVSVQSFGFGGTNAHAIVDDAASYLLDRNLAGHHQVQNPQQNRQDQTNVSQNVVNDYHQPVDDEKQAVSQLLVWSAADSSALDRMSQAYVDYYRQHVDGKQFDVLNRLSYTLAARRTAMSCRRYAVVGAGEMLSLSAMSKSVALSKSQNPCLAFVFTGQGAQYAGMGNELKRYPIFAQSLAKAGKILSGLGCTWSVADAFQDSDSINNPSMSQPLCTILQLALLDLLQSFNILPKAVVGHSSGEIAAAYASGALSFDSACRVAYYRGQVAEAVRTTSRSDPGAMLSVGLSEEDVSIHLQGTQIHVACVNSPSNVTLSGSSHLLDELRTRLSKQGIFAQIVRTGVAYHSPAMQCVASEYVRLMGVLEPRSDVSKHSTCTMVSSVTGHVIDPEILRRPQYWLDNLLSPVQFVKALQNLNKASLCSRSSFTITDIVEVGPHAALRRPVKDSVPTLSYHSVLNRSKSSLITTLELVGSLFALGSDVSVTSANGQTPDVVTPAPLTNCPPYPFDHSKRYWVESRISKDYRMRAHAPGHLLGRPAQDWNPLQPRWRNWLCTESMPWLVDHVVDGIAVCPGTGMVVMAIEAASQVARSQSLTISGFLLKNVQFLAPIIVRENLQDAAETVVELKPIQNEMEKNSVRFDASIFSYLEGNWKTCFKAELHLQKRDANPVQLSWNDETSREHDRVRREFYKAAAQCDQPVDQSTFYTFCEEKGLKYGSSFQLLDDIHSNGQDTSIARIDMRSAQEQHGVAESPVHPAILDALVHLLMARIVCGNSKEVATSVPRRIKSVWISPKVWDKDTDFVHLISSKFSNTHARVKEGTNFNVIDVEGRVLCMMEGLIMAEVSQRDSTEEKEEHRRLLHSIAWKPKLSFLDAQQLKQICSEDLFTNEDPARKAFYPKIESAVGMAVHKALRQLTNDDRNRMSITLQRFVAGLEHQFCKQPPSIHELDDEELEKLFQECESEQPGWRLFPAVSRALPSILRGETDPLEILFKDNAAKDFYSLLIQKFTHDSRLRSFLDLATHENPGFQILEVGAGTGGMTRSVLDIIQDIEKANGQKRFKGYTYTDISPAFFDEAKKTFGEFNDRMTFRKLDLEKDALQQDFGRGKYDMIIAGSVLHATTDLNATLTNLRKLLKPHGYLVFLEVTVLNSACVNVGFGPIDGWWLAQEEYRRYSPLITEERWDEVLRAAGFSGIDIAMRDYEDEKSHVSSVMISTSIGPPPGLEMTNGHKEQDIVMVVTPGCGRQEYLALETMRQRPTARIMHPLQLADSQTELDPSTVVVFLLELETPMLAGLDEANFQMIRKCIQKSENIMWISSSNKDSENVEPALSVATGFFRTIRNEHSSKHIVTLSLESAVPGSEGTLLSQLLESCFLGHDKTTEVEFVARDGLLSIGRIKEEIELDEECNSYKKPTLITEPWGAGPPLKLELGTPGRLDTLQWVEDLQPELDPEEVEIEAAAVPISFRDIFIALGRLGDQPMGFECAGVVSRVGSACTSKFQPGDRVMLMSTGCMRSRPRALADKVLRIPDSMSFNDAVASVNPGATVWRALVQISRLQRGDKILIHAAAGSTGQLAVKIAKYVGAEVFVTVGSDAKRKLVMDPNGLNIPESNVFYSRDTSFAKALMRVTDGYGVDVVLNSLSGQGLIASWECIAPYGRFIDISKTDIMANTSLPMSLFAKNVTYSAVDLEHISYTDSTLTRQLAQKILALVADKNFGGGPKPLHIYPASDVQKAFRYMQSGENTGRIILELNPDANVPKRIKRKSNWKFSADASYVVAGGLGGVGRSVLAWMCDRGAKNLIVPSRSGSSSQAAKDVAAELQARGVNIITPKCDVASADQLANVLKDCSNLPPIRGCVNLAMVLQDSIFDNMTQAQWELSIRSKVYSSWNLHRLLPQNLDFFVLISSLSGIYGSLSQSNYAAGNSFLDALARMRATQTGHRTSVSIDLGWMQNIGIIAEKEEFRRTRERIRDMVPLQAEDLHSVLEHYCNPTLARPSQEQSQVFLGLTTPIDSLIRGEEPPAHLCSPMFAPFDSLRSNSSPKHTNSNGGNDANSDEHNPLNDFRNATDLEGRSTAVAEVLKQKLAIALCLSPDDIDVKKCLADYGVDSLIAIELRTLIWQSFRVSLAVFELMAPGDIAALGALVASKVDVPTASSTSTS